MKIVRLEMENFRGFERAALDLDRPLTVLFGVNGAGKSSVLAACACVLRDRWGLDPQDIHIGAETLQVTIKFTGDSVVPQEAVRRYPSLFSGLSPGLSGNPPRGLAIFYDTSRDVATSHEVFGSNGDANDDPLTVGRVRFRPLFLWFKDREDAENELKVSRKDLSLEDPQLSAVRRAVAGMLPGFSGLRMQRDPLHMIIRKGEDVLLVDQLSDGEKMLLALTADLARRLAIHYRDTADPLSGEAVVLIDEVELHLHPSWQRRVLGALQRTFPNCQFIVTTHSPQVLSEVPNDAVVLIKDFQLVRPNLPTSGRDTNAILSEVMDTPERPAAQLASIRAVAALIDEGKYAEAKAAVEALARDLSEADREVVGLRTMIHFMDEGARGSAEGPAALRHETRLLRLDDLPS